MTEAEKRLVVGKIAGAHGVQGWVKVRSDTRPAGNLLNYSPWYLYKNSAFSTRTILQCREQPNGLLALLEGCATRDDAQALAGSEIFVERAEMPAPEPGEVYWDDLIGCNVRTGSGDELGAVTGLIETGGHDVLVIQGERERLIPYVQDVYITKVDFSAKLIEVDWDPEA